MSKYVTSDAALKKISKDEVIALSLEYRDKFGNTLWNTNKDLTEFSNNFEKIPSEPAISKNVNTELQEQIVELERQCRHERQAWASGILWYFSIEHCHWLLGRGPKKVTVKRFRWKNSNTIRRSKKYWKVWICLPSASEPQILLMIASALTTKCSGVNIKSYGQINLFMSFRYQMVR